MTTIFQDKLQHKLPIEQSDINYFIIDTKEYRPATLSSADYDKIYAEIILNAMDEVSDKFNVTFSSLGNLDSKQEKINYYLFGLVDPLKIDDHLLDYLKNAKTSPNSRVNVAMIFEENNASQASKIILELDKTLGVNTIYQDTHVKYAGKTYVTISAVDAADNMVCETFRVKYKTIRKTDAESLKKLKQARQEAGLDVLKMQDIYDKYQLWHRSPYDGAFMFLTKHGWLTTATRTPKNDVKPEDLSLILNFYEKSETITYAGDRLPSSDLPEFLVLVERNEQALAERGEKTPVIKYMAHFHKNEITRNPLFAKYAVPFYRYGVPESGHKFADELYINKKATDGINISGKGRGFIILEHGLVRMGVKLEHLEDFLQNFEIPIIPKQ